MTTIDTQKLRVLLADHGLEELEVVADTVVALGHTVVAREIEVGLVGPATAREHPDVALVALGGEEQHTLAMIDKIVAEAECPVILLLLGERDPVFVKEAARRGIFGYVGPGDTDDLQSEIEIVLSRFGEFHRLEGAFGRRIVTEQAKGILMERHAINEEDAFQMLRSQARSTNQRLIGIAQAVRQSYLLLPKERPQD